MMDNPVDDEFKKILTVHPGTSWMYFVSKPRRERMLFESLREQNVPAYLPLQQKTTEYSRRVYNRWLPMFSGYVFASTCRQGFDIGKLNPSLLKVNFLSEPQGAELLEDLKIVRKFEVLSRQHKVEVCPRLAPGTPVLIRKGEFKGDYAIVERKKNGKSVIVNLHWVEMSLHVELPVDWVEEAGAAFRKES